MFFKKAKITPAPPPVEAPDGWLVEVRQQNKSYGWVWEWRITPPERIFQVYKQAAYTGADYRDKGAARDAAIDMAWFVERNNANRAEKWETV